MTELEKAYLMLTAEFPRWNKKQDRRSSRVNKQRPEVCKPWMCWGPCCTEAECKCGPAPQGDC